MSDLNFLQILAATTCAELLRQTICNPKKIASELQKRAMGGKTLSIDQIMKAQGLAPNNSDQAKPASASTPEQQALDEFYENLQKMEAESQEYNNPQDFAKYGKMQRNILKLKKQGSILEDAAKEANERAAQQKAVEDAQKKEIEQQQQPQVKEQTSSTLKFLRFLGMLPKLRTLGFVVMMVLFYFIPMFCVEWLNGPSDLMFNQVSEDEIWPLSMWIGTVFEYGEHRALFIPFRTVYICSLFFSSNFVSMGLAAVYFKA